MEDNFNGMYSKGPRHAENNAGKGNSKEYRVSYKQGTGGEYTSLIRFVVNPKRPEDSIVSKWVTWLKDPVTKTSRPIDNPQTVNADYNPINALFWPLFRSDNAKLVNLAKECISTNQQHASIIQVINDQNRPELNGKFLIFRYGKKLRDMIDAEENGTQYTEGRDPFDVFTGRCFMLKCVNQGGNNNYDQSKFIDSSTGSGLLFTTGQKDATGKDILFQAKPEIENIQQFMYKYLLDNCPDLSEYAYKQWDSATADYVAQTLQVIENAAQNGGVPVNANAFGAPQAAVVNAIPGVNGAPTQPQSVQGLLSAQLGATGVPQHPVAPQVPTAPQIGATIPQFPATHGVPQQPQVAVQPQVGVPMNSIELPDLGTQGTQEEADAPHNQFGNIDDLIKF